MFRNVNMLASRRSVQWAEPGEAASARIHLTLLDASFLSVSCSTSSVPWHSWSGNWSPVPGAPSGRRLASADGWNIDPQTLRHRWRVSARKVVILLHPAEAKRCFVISRNVTKFQWQKQKVPWLQKRPFLPLLLLLSCHLYTRKMFRLQFYNSQRTGSLPLAQHLQLAKLKDWTMLLACPAPTIYLLRTSHSERHHLLRNVCHCDFLLVLNTVFLRIWNTAFTCWFQAQDQLKTINDSLISRSITMLQKDIFGGRKTLTINWK